VPMPHKWRLRFGVALAASVSACHDGVVRVTIPPPNCTLAADGLECPPTASLAWRRTNRIPPYNRVLVQAGIWGRATAEIRVSEAGTVDSVRVVGVSNETMREPIQATLRGWRFDPFWTTDTGEAITAGSGRRTLVVEFLFRAYGCRTVDPAVSVLPLRGSLLIEVVECTSNHQLSNASSCRLTSA